MPSALQVFVMNQRKCKFWQDDDNRRKSQGVSRVITIYPERHMNLYTGFHRNVSNSPFHTNPQMWNSWWHYRKSQRIIKASRIHPPNIVTLDLDQSVGPTEQLSTRQTQLNIPSRCSWDWWQYLSWLLVVTWASLWCTAVRTSECQSEPWKVVTVNRTKRNADMLNCTST